MVNTCVTLSPLITVHSIAACFLTVIRSSVQGQTVVQQEKAITCVRVFSCRVTVCVIIFDECTFDFLVGEKIKYDALVLFLSEALACPLSPPSTVSNGPDALVSPLREMEKSGWLSTDSEFSGLVVIHFRDSRPSQNPSPTHPTRVTVTPPILKESPALLSQKDGSGWSFSIFSSAAARSVVRPAFSLSMFR